MKIKSYEIFRCDAGWRLFSFLKLVTDSGPVGWSEYNESFGSPGLSGVIENLMPSVLGMDPMDIELVNAVLATKSTQSRGGVVRQAIAAIENALLDIKGKALGVPVYELLGGRKHDLVVGMSSTRTAARTDGYTSVAGWSYVIPNIYTWDGNAPAPTYSKTGAWRTQITQQTGLFASARWRVTDPLSVLTGLRLTDWHRHSDTYGTTGAYAGRSAIQDENRKVTPYVGAVYDITPTLSAYASYARIFNPQNYKDRNNNPLSPVIGSNAEAGLKAELFERRIQAHFAVFQTKQDNFGVRDGAITTPLPDDTLPYVAVNGTKSTGC